MKQFTVKYQTVKVNGVKKMVATVYLLGGKLTITENARPNFKQFVTNHVNLLLSLSNQSQLINKLSK